MHRVRGVTGRRMAAGALFLSVVVYGCAGGAPSGGLDRTNDAGGTGGAGGGFGFGGGAGGASGQACTSAADCPATFTCLSNICVPPEQEINRGTGDAPPVATPRYVYALNPTAASVARIDPTSLAIEAIPVGPGPVSLAALSGEDACVVLSRDDGSLSVVDSANLPSKVIRLPLRRQYDQLAVSPDGQWAVAWPSPDRAPTSGAEGVFAVVDVARARAGAPADEVVLERAGGYRLTNVVFRIEAGVATRLHVFAKGSVSTFPLPLTAALPVRLPLPAALAQDVLARELVANADGSVIMLRTTLAPELASFDGTTISLLPLPEVATDLDLLPDGSAAVAALRTQATVAYVQIPQDLIDPTGIEYFPVAGGLVGQIALPPSAGPTGMFAYVYSNASDTESFARVDLPSGTVTQYPLEKLVDEISVSPDGKSALIIHRANPGTTAQDPYEAQVDREQGFSIFDVGTGFWQLQRTQTVVPSRYAFSPRGGYVGVALRNDAARKYSLMAVNLGTLISTTVSLASTPLFMGTVPETAGVTPHRVFVSQEHPAGRISVIQLDSGQVRTATGFTLNAEIQ